MRDHIGFQLVGDPAYLAVPDVIVLLLIGLEGFPGVFVVGGGGDAFDIKGVVLVTVNALGS